MYRLGRLRIPIPQPTPLRTQIASPNPQSQTLILMRPSFLAIVISFFLMFSSSYSNMFTITNNCPYTIWPGTLAGSGTPQLPTTGFRLDSGRSVGISSAPGWSGRIWARTGCNFDVSGVGKCQTGDCGGRLECDGSGASPPASLFEITLGKGDTKDFYDVSIVDGYNLPIIAIPRGANGACNATGCAVDINLGCPKELQVVGGDGGGEGGVVACKSACEAFGLDQYCCSGQFANPTTCQPSFYSSIFKRACPRAYSYAFDDGTSTFTCKANEYVIIFCPKSVRRPVMVAPPATMTPPITVAPPAMETPPVANTPCVAAPAQYTGMGKAVKMASSSSYTLLPAPVSIILTLCLVCLKIHGALVTSLC